MGWSSLLTTGTNLYVLEDERRAVLARLIEEPDWKPPVDSDVAAVLVSLQESGWVELNKKRRHYDCEVTSEGLLKHYLWEGE